MRDFLDSILEFIEAASLSDEEFDSIDLDEQAYNIETYDALLTILDDRETVSTTRDRLRYYFLAKNVAVPSSIPARSNVWIGSPV